MYIFVLFSKEFVNRARWWRRAKKERRSWQWLFMYVLPQVSYLEQKNLCSFLSVYIESREQKNRQYVVLWKRFLPKTYKCRRSYWLMTSFLLDVDDVWKSLAVSNAVKWLPFCPKKPLDHFNEHLLCINFSTSQNICLFPFKKQLSLSFKN